MIAPRFTLWNVFSDELTLYYFGEHCDTIVLEVNTDASVRYMLQRQDHPELFGILAAFLDGSGKDAELD